MKDDVKELPALKAHVQRLDVQQYETARQLSWQDSQLRWITGVLFDVAGKLQVRRIEPPPEPPGWDNRDQVEPLK